MWKLCENELFKHSTNGECRERPKGLLERERESNSKGMQGLSLFRVSWIFVEVATPCQLHDFDKCSSMLQ